MADTNGEEQSKKPGKKRGRKPIDEQFRKDIHLSTYVNKLQDDFLSTESTLLNITKSAFICQLIEEQRIVQQGFIASHRSRTRRLGI